MRWLLIGAGVLLFVVFCWSWLTFGTADNVGAGTLVGIVVGLISGGLIVTGFQVDR
jgi:hypothetical protein